MSECTALCGRPAGDAFVCRPCGQALADDLAAVPGLARELDVTLTRQGRTGLPVGNTSGSPRRPLPYDARASDVLTELRAILVGWVRLCAEEHLSASHRAATDPISGPSVGDPLPPDNLEALSAFLAERVEALRHHPAGHEAVDEIGHVIARARRAVDVPEARWYAGPCADCGRDLYARVRATEIACVCGRPPYDVEARRAELLGQVEDRLGTTTEISRAVTTLAGRAITPSVIRNHVARGQLAVKGHDAQGRTLYRIGDVLGLVLARAS